MKPDPADYWVEFLKIGFGCRQATCFMRGWAQPVGVVWFHAFDNQFGTATLQIADSFVPHSMRRKGVRTTIHKALLQSWPDCIIITGAPSTEDGEAWMLATGFIKTDLTSQWVFRSEPKEKA